MKEEEKRAYIHERTKKDVWREIGPEDVIYERGASWIFDFRKVFLEAKFIRTCAELFWDTFEDQMPFQVGGIESAAIPLITAIALEGEKRGKTISAFYMRKSRKKAGLGRVIEGKLTNEPIILVDDLINRGNSFLKLKETLTYEHKIVRAVFTLVRFRAYEHYRQHLGEDIEVHSLFSLNDFGKDLLQSKSEQLQFSQKWYFRSEKPHFFHHKTKSLPVTLDSETLLFGSDSGTLWFLDRKTGEVKHKRSFGFPWKKYKILHTPLIMSGHILVSIENGDVYAVDIAGRKVKWGFFELDNTIAGPLEVGAHVCVVGNSRTPSKQGSLCLLDSESGKVRERYDTTYPLARNVIFDSKNNVMYALSIDGTLHIVNAKTASSEHTIGSGELINGSFSLDDSKQVVYATSSTGNMHIFDLEKRRYKKIELGVLSTSKPLILRDTIIISSLDKTIYCFNKNDFSLVWKFATRGRVFASPVLHNEHIYVGSNDGRLYVLENSTGKLKAYFQATERIIDPVCFDSETGTILLTTQANELYALESLNL